MANQNQKGIASTLAIIIVITIGIIAIGGVLAYQYLWVPEEEVEKKEKEDRRDVPVITNISSNIIKVGSNLIINGNNFSDDNNIIILTPSNPEILSSEDIQIYKIPATNKGQTITILISPEKFNYGTCRLSGGFCQGELSQIPDGIYYISILNNICSGYNCESNKVLITITNS